VYPAQTRALAIGQTARGLVAAVDPAATPKRAMTAATLSHLI